MDPSKFVILGAKGQLGTALTEKYPTARSVDSHELNIADREAVEAFNWQGVTHILNAAAYTNVDNAETDEGRRTAWAINAAAVANLVAVAAQYGATLVHISSDYVFDGTQEIHNEDEPLSPLSVYGQSKAAGDIAATTALRHYILRTSWVIGDGNNFVKTMKSLADRGVKPTVVSDQIGRLTFTDTLASAIKHLIDKEAPYGTYNISNDGESVSWADIAKKVYVLAGKEASDVTPVSTEQYYEGKTGIAPRPLQSTLNIAKIQKMGFSPENWEEKLRTYFKDLETEGDAS